jgi:hypothetical protein
LGSDSIPADNYTYAVIEDTLVDLSVLDTSSAVTFTTDNGVFSTGGTTYATKFDQTGKAYAYVRNKWPVAAHVQASVGANYALTLTLPFQTAWPDSLYLQLPAIVADTAGAMVTFTTKLVRPLGTPTPGLQPGFWATNAAGARVGSFYNITPSDTAGNVSAAFWPLDLADKGSYLTVTAYLVVGVGDTIKGRGLVYLH